MEEATATMKRSKKLKEMPSQHTNELPDCVISYIFSKLSMKDLVKTSTLSKRWLHEWGSRMDLNFDPHNMFDNINTPQELHSFLSSSFFEPLQSEFARRVDQFMLHYQGAKIHSLRVDFPLGDEHNDTIDRWIFQGIAKGVERIELHFARKTNADLLWGIKPYKFSCTLLSGSDCLKYLHLQKCLLVPPMDFSGFKNLRTLVLHLVSVEKGMLLALLSSCIHLVDLTLNECKFNYDLNITSPTLCHLKIVDPIYYGGGASPWKIEIFTLNLSSFECANFDGTSRIDIKAPQLSKFSCGCLKMPDVGFSRFKNLRTIVFDGLRVQQDLLPCLFSECLQLEDLTLKRCTLMSDINIISPTLRHLNIIDCGSKLDHRKIHIDTLNLSSFEYGGDHKTLSSIKAPQLLNFYWDATSDEETPLAFDLIASLHHLENLAMIMSHLQGFRTLIARPRGLRPFQYLRKLDFFIHGVFEQDFFWVLNIVMASPCLQKLCLMIRRSHLVPRQRQRREHEHAGFSHNELKYVELRGCVGNIDEIELAIQFLKNVNSLKQITFSPCDRFYIGSGIWTKGFTYYNNWFQKGRDWIREMLKDEVNEQCRLIIL